MTFKISLKKNAIKALQHIDKPNFPNIKKATYNLADSPRPTGYKKLKGRSGYQIRVADYRIIYEIFDDILLIEVIELGDLQMIKAAAMFKK